MPRGAERRVRGAVCIALAMAACGVLRAAAQQQQDAAEARPRLVSHVLPVYPQRAIAARVQGVVIVAGRISAAGGMEDVRIQRSVPLLDDAATAALAQWRFEPPGNGTPAVEIAVNFVLDARTAHPSPFTSPLPSWVPTNFAFQYTVHCATGAVALDSVTGRIRFAVESGRSDAPLAFESQDATDLFVALVQAGFYTPVVSALAEETTAAAEITQENGRIVVTVAAAPPLQQGQVVDSRARWVSHELAVRGGRTWRTVRWSGSDAPSGAPELRAIAAIARQLHESVLMRVEEQGIQRPDVCL